MEIKVGKLGEYFFRIFFLVIISQKQLLKDNHFQYLDQ